MSIKLLLVVLMSMATGVLLISYALSNKKLSQNTEIVIFIVGVSFIITSIMFALTLTLYMSL